jgi:hypothetical protein
LSHALLRAPQAIVWEEDTKAAPSKVANDEDSSGLVAH